MYTRKRAEPEHGGASLSPLISLSLSPFFFLSSFSFSFSALLSLRFSLSNYDNDHSSSRLSVHTALRVVQHESPALQQRNTLSKIHESCARSVVCHTQLQQWYLSVNFLETSVERLLDSNTVKRFAESAGLIQERLA